MEDSKSVGTIGTRGSHRSRKLHTVVEDDHELLLLKGSEGVSSATTASALCVSPNSQTTAVVSEVAKADRSKQPRTTTTMNRNIPKQLFIPANKTKTPSRSSSNKQQKRPSTSLRSPKTKEKNPDPSPTKTTTTRTTTTTTTSSRRRYSSRNTDDVHSINSSTTQHTHKSNTSSSSSRKAPPPGRYRNIPTSPDDNASRGSIGSSTSRHSRTSKTGSISRQIRANVLRRKAEREPNPPLTVTTGASPTTTTGSGVGRGIGGNRTRRHRSNGSIASLVSCSSTEDLVSRSSSPMAAAASRATEAPTSPPPERTIKRQSSHTSPTFLSQARQRVVTADVVSSSSTMDTYRMRRGGGLARGLSARITPTVADSHDRKRSTTNTNTHTTTRAKHTPSHTTTSSSPQVKRSRTLPYPGESPRRLSTATTTITSIPLPSLSPTSSLPPALPPHSQSSSSSLEEVEGRSTRTTPTVVLPSSSSLSPVNTTMRTTHLHHHHPHGTNHHQQQQEESIVSILGGSWDDDGNATSDDDTMALLERCGAASVGGGAAATTTTTTTAAERTERSVVVPSLTTPSPSQFPRKSVSDGVPFPPRQQQQRLQPSTFQRSQSDAAADGRLEEVAMGAGSGARIRRSSITSNIFIPSSSSSSLVGSSYRRALHSNPIPPYHSTTTPSPSPSSSGITPPTTTVAATTTTQLLGTTPNTSNVTTTNTGKTTTYSDDAAQRRITALRQRRFLAAGSTSQEEMAVPPSSSSPSSSSLTPATTAAAAAEQQTTRMTPPPKEQNNVISPILLSPSSDDNDDEYGENDNKSLASLDSLHLLDEDDNIISLSSPQTIQSNTNTSTNTPHNPNPTGFHTNHHPEIMQPSPNNNNHQRRIQQTSQQPPLPSSHITTTYTISGRVHTPPSSSSLTSPIITKVVLIDVSGGKPSTNNNNNNNVDEDEDASSDDHSATTSQRPRPPIKTDHDGGWRFDNVDVGTYLVKLLEKKKGEEQWGLQDDDDEGRREMWRVIDVWENGGDVRDVVLGGFVEGGGGEGGSVSSGWSSGTSTLTTISSRQRHVVKGGGGGGGGGGGSLPRIQSFSDEDEDKDGGKDMGHDQKKSIRFGDNSGRGNTDRWNESFLSVFGSIDGDSKDGDGDSDGDGDGDSNRNSMVSGTLYAGQRIPIRSATVYLVDVTPYTSGPRDIPSRPSRSITTGANGQFHFDRVGLGTYVVRVEDNWSLPTVETLPRTTFAAKLVELLTDGDVVQGLEFGYRKTMDVSSTSSSDAIVGGGSGGGEESSVGQSTLTRSVNTQVTKTTRSSPLNLARMIQDRKLFTSSDEDSYVNPCPPLVSYISGRVYEDRSNRGMDGVTVYLVDIAKGGADGDGDGVVRRVATTTDSSGGYAFQNVRPGTYVVRIVGYDSKPGNTIPTSNDDPSNPSNPSHNSTHSSSLTTHTSPLSPQSIPPTPLSMRFRLSSHVILNVEGGTTYHNIHFSYHRLEMDLYSLLFFATPPAHFTRRLYSLRDTIIIHTSVFTVFALQITALMILLNDVQYYSYTNTLRPHAILKLDTLFTHQQHRILVPIPLARTLICSIAALFQSDVISLTRTLYSGYSVYFPAKTLTVRLDHFLFVISCTSRFVVRAMGVLVALVVVIYDDDLVELFGDLAVVALLTGAHRLLFWLLLRLPLIRGGVLGRLLAVWRNTASEVASYEYLRTGGRAMVMRKLEFIFILSAMPGMWGWTNFLHSLKRRMPNPPLANEELHYEITNGEEVNVTAIDNEPYLFEIEPIDSDSDTGTLEQELIELRAAVSATNSQHERDLQTLRDEASAASSEHKRLLQSTIDSITDRKDQEILNLRTTNEQNLRERDLLFEEEIANWKRRLDESEEMVNTLQANHRATEVEWENKVAALAHEVKSATDVLITVQARFRKEIEEVREVAKSALAAAHLERSREAQEQLEAAIAAKDREIDELRSHEEDLRTKREREFDQEIVVWREQIEELDALSTTQKTNIRETEGLRRELEEERWKAKESEGKCNAALGEKEKELDVLRYKHPVVLGLDDEDLELLCPVWLVGNKTLHDEELILACRNFALNHPNSSSTGVIDHYVEPSSRLFLLRGKTVQYGLLMVTVPLLQNIPPVQRLIRKTLLLASSSRPFLTKSFKGVISISKTWLKAHKRT